MVDVYRDKREYGLDRRDFVKKLATASAIALGIPQAYNVVKIARKINTTDCSPADSEPETQKERVEVLECMQKEMDLLDSQRNDAIGLIAITGVAAGINLIADITEDQSSEKIHPDIAYRHPELPLEKDVFDGV